MSLSYVHIRYGEWSDERFGAGPGDKSQGTFVRAPQALWGASSIQVRTYPIPGYTDAFFISPLDVPVVTQGLTGAAYANVGVKFELCPCCLGKYGTVECGAWEFLKARKKPHSYEPQYDWQAEEAKRQHAEEAAKETAQAKVSEEYRRRREQEPQWEWDWWDQHQRNVGDKTQRDHEKIRQEAKRKREADARAKHDGARTSPFERKPRESLEDWLLRIMRMTGGSPFSNPDFVRFWEQERRQQTPPRSDTHQSTYGRTVDPEPSSSFRDSQREDFHRQREARRKQQEEQARPRTSYVSPMSYQRAKQVLGITASIGFTSAELKSCYHKRALECHPDRGGSHEAMSEVNSAYEFLQGWM